MRIHGSVTLGILLAGGLACGSAVADEEVNESTFAAPLVVIDPGHGGSNLGAAGRLAGVQEKRVTLALARALARKLERDGLRVELTRRRDQYLTLGERVRRANQAGAALFVSLHVAASPQHDRRGADVFVAARDLSEVAAERAGRSDDAVAAILARAEARQLERRSTRLAAAIISRLAGVRPTGRAVRPAAYDVLEGLAMPAVLVQAGYLDHAVEGRELVRRDILAAIANAVADGIVDFSSGRGQAIVRR